MYIRPYMYLCIHFSYSLASTYEGKHVTFCSSEPGLLYLTWWSIVLSIYLQITGKFLYGWIIPHCVCVYICIYHIFLT
jgi:hypothetical protein